jgi:membrane protein involved in D-alanine export
MATYIVLLLLCKLFLPNTAYRYVLLVLNFAFVFIAFPYKYAILLFILYSYFITYVFHQYIKIKQKFPVVLLLIAPLFFIKLGDSPYTIHIEFIHVLYFAGISFVTFRSVSYWMDKNPNEQMAHPVSYFNYLSFTPTLLIGPIDRFSNYVLSEKNGFTNINTDNFIAGWNYFIKGLVFKYLLAEGIERYWLSLFDYFDPHLIAMVNTMYAYYFYLFFDFAGYSFMAMGISKMMGVEVPLNFKNPFVAKNPQEFWESFHIALGNWLREYFFKPINLFLGRKKSLKRYPLMRQNAALFFTFLLMGCWNGLEKHYILSGALFGIYSLAHNTYKSQCKKMGKDVVFGNINTTVVNVISMFIMFNLVALAMYVFSGRYPHSISFHLF